MQWISELLAKKREIVNNALGAQLILMVEAGINPLDLILIEKLPASWTIDGVIKTTYEWKLKSPGGD